jgi:lipopolysaccharide export system permease protein
MLFHSSIRKDMARSFWTSWMVLFTIVMTLMLIRTLGLAADGQFDPESLYLALGYSAVGRMPTVLSIALFVAVVSAMSRMYQDSEMVIWFNSGAGLLSFIKPVMRFAWPILLAVAAMQWFVWPWSNQQLDDLKSRFEARGDLERVAPGQFRESASGEQVFFMDKDTGVGVDGSNIFVSSSTSRGKSVIAAQSARVIQRDGGQYVELSQGQQMSRSPDGTTTRIIDFERHGTRTDDEVLVNAAVTAKSTPSWDLLKKPTPHGMGELTWRVGMALASINFVLLALAVAKVNNRSSKGMSLAFALLTSQVYLNMLSVGQGWVVTQKVSPLGFMVGLHGGVFAVCVLWLYLRHVQFDAWHWLRHRLLPTQKTTAPSAAAATGTPA